MTDPHTGCALAIVGSRDVPDYLSSSLVKQAILEHKPSIVISGGARGVDTMAEVIAREMGIPVMQFRPQQVSWDAMPMGEPVEAVADNGMIVTVPGGYKARNMKIAESCDCLVRIASSTTKTYGSGWTADYAERIGKRVVRHTV
jgi:cytoskeletal protein RodZ